MRLSRVSYTADGTFGVLSAKERVSDDYIPKWVTLENPWEGNEPFISCIPCGRYKVKPVDSPKFGKTWEVQNVEGRTSILFHAGNRHTETHGCILLGTQYGYLGSIPAILNSRTAFNDFKFYLTNYAEFTLDIVDIDGVPF